jgi:hypothetical protein
METILERQQYIHIYRTSHLFLISSLYAVYRGYYTIAIAPCAVFLTSINYWRRPDYSWRLYLDLTVVRSAILYQTILAYNAEYAVIYYSLFTTAILYPLGVYYYSKKDYWKYTYIHMTCHILANIGNCILYSGKMT